MTRPSPFRAALIAVSWLALSLSGCGEDDEPVAIVPEPELEAAPTDPGPDESVEVETPEQVAEAARRALRTAGFAPTLPLTFESEDADAEVYDRLATLLLASPRLTRVRIGAHSDPRGSAEWNRRLTRERARAAASALVARGVPCERIEPTGWGEDRPLEGASTEAQRRVELTILRVDGVDLAPGDVEGPDACE